MIEDPQYIVQFPSVQNDNNGTVWYTVNVFNSKEGEAWTFKERFSRFRMIHQNCQKSQWKNDLPMFPRKRLSVNTYGTFIQQRMKELQNYYSTFFKTFNIHVFPELQALLNTNKPIKEQQKFENKINDAVQSNKAKSLKKQKQIKNILKQIVAKCQQQMIQINQQDYVEEQVRSMFEKRIIKQIIDFKSILIDNFSLPVCDKQNGTDFLSSFFADKHADNLLKLQKIGSEVAALIKQIYICPIKFVVLI